MLNAGQARAIAEQGNLVVLACPGSGKTRTIVAKVGAIVAANPRAAIGAVSFTRESAKQLSDRIRDEHGRQVLERCTVGTFHSLALRLLKQAGAAKKIIGEAEKQDYLLRALKQTKIRGLAKDEAVRAIESRKSALSYQPSNEPGDKLLDAYSELLTRNGVMDFFDIISNCVNLLRQDRIQPYPFTHLLADEFQDADEYQHAFLFEFMRRGTVITVVADDDQSIYGWRNAKGYHGVEDFAARAQAAKITLGTNYRCRSEILAAADRLICRNHERVVKKLEAERGPGGSIKTYVAANADEEAEFLAGELLKRYPPGPDGRATVPADTWAVLGRTNRQILTISAAFKRMGIPHTMAAGGKDFWESVPIIFLLRFLQAIEHSNGRGGEKAAIDVLLHYVGVTHEDLTTLHHQLGDSFRSLLDGTHSVNLEAFSDRSKTVLREFFERANQWAANAGAKRYNLALSGITEWMAKHAASDDHMNVIQAAAANLKRMKGSLSERIGRLLAPQTKDAGPGVVLLTMHGAKGLEFPSVWIIGARDGVTPSPDSPVEEERRLFYVAITRAKDELVVSYYSNPSQFLAESILPPPTVIDLK